MFDFNYLKSQFKACFLRGFFSFLLDVLLSFLCSLEGTKALIHSGGYYREATPVPIPNTEVKLAGADNTRLATAREDRLLPDLIPQ